MFWLFYYWFDVEGWCCDVKWYVRLIVYVGVFWGWYVEFGGVNLWYLVWYLGCGWLEWGK